MAFSKVGSGGPDDEGDAASRLGPSHVDNMLRQSFSFLWMVLPKDRRNVDEVEREFRRLVDRALKDMREDGTAFGP